MSVCVFLLWVFLTNISVPCLSETGLIHYLHLSHLHCLDHKRNSPLAPYQYMSLFCVQTVSYKDPVAFEILIGANKGKRVCIWKKGGKGHCYTFITLYCHKGVALPIASKSLSCLRTSKVAH